MKDRRPVYKLTLRPEPDPTDPDGIRRLRALLKAALRSYGLKCIEVAPEGPPGTDRQAGTGWRALSAVVAGILRDGEGPAGSSNQEVSREAVLLTQGMEGISRNGCE